MGEAARDGILPGDGTVSFNPKKRNMWEDVIKRVGGETTSM